MVDKTTQILYFNFLSVAPFADIRFPTNFHFVYSDTVENPYNWLYFHCSLNATTLFIKTRNEVDCSGCQALPTVACD